MPRIISIQAVCSMCVLHKGSSSAIYKLVFWSFCSRTTWPLIGPRTKPMTWAIFLHQPGNRLLDIQPIGGFCGAHCRDALWSEMRIGSGGHIVRWILASSHCLPIWSSPNSRNKAKIHASFCFHLLWRPILPRIWYIHAPLWLWHNNRIIEGFWSYVTSMWPRKSILFSKSNTLILLIFSPSSTFRRYYLHDCDDSHPMSLVCIIDPAWLTLPAPHSRGE